MILIDKAKPDWNRIKAEYVSGVESLRSLSEKHCVPFSTIRRRAEREKWSADREAARIEIRQSVVKETAKKTADVATLAADIQKKGLMILEGLMDDFAQVTATERRETRKGVTDIKRLRDLTAAYKDLTENITKQDAAGNPILDSLYRLMNEGASDE